MTGGMNMSAFLGPIHFWLYDKIKIQNEIVEEILDYAEKNNENIRSELYAKFGDGDLKPLSEVIDVTNIHGWLQERVADKLVKELALHLRENKIKAVSTCSYAIDWFEKHPEFKDVCR
jgi:predicted GNAT family acetyltransferase